MNRQGHRFHGFADVTSVPLAQVLRRGSGCSTGLSQDKFQWICELRSES